MIRNVLGPTTAMASVFYTLSPRRLLGLCRKQVRLRMGTENQKIRVGALKQTDVCLLIFRINPKMIYGRIEEKIPFTYIYNMYMVLFLLILILYGEKAPQIAPKAAKIPSKLPTSRRGTLEGLNFVLVL